MLAHTQLGGVFCWGAATPTQAKPSEEWSKQHCPVKAEHLVVAKKKIEELRNWLDQQRPEQQRQHLSSRVLLLTGWPGLMRIIVGLIIPAANVCWSCNGACHLLAQLWQKRVSTRQRCCCHHHPAGAPGSGKTTAVQVLAAELGFDLCEWQPAAVTSWEECEHSRQVCVVGRQTRNAARTAASATSCLLRSALVWQLHEEAPPGCNSCMCGPLCSLDYMFLDQMRCVQWWKAAGAQSMHITC